MDWNTYYNFPVTYRRWIMKRLQKEIEKAQGGGEQQMGSHAHASAQERSLMGKTNPHAPPGNRRF